MDPICSPCVWVRRQKVSRIPRTTERDAKVEINEITGPFYTNRALATRYGQDIWSFHIFSVFSRIANSIFDFSRYPVSNHMFGNISVSGRITNSIFDFCQISGIVPNNMANCLTYLKYPIHPYSQPIYYHRWSQNIQVNL